MTHNPDDVRYCGQCKEDLLIEPAKRKWCSICNPLDDVKMQLHLKLIDLAPEPQLVHAVICSVGVGADSTHVEFGYKASGELPYLTANGTPAWGRTIHPDREIARTKWRELWLKAYLASCSVRLPPEEPKAAAPAVEQPRLPEPGEEIEVRANERTSWHLVQVIEYYGGAVNIQGAGYSGWWAWPGNNARWPLPAARLPQERVPQVGEPIEMRVNATWALCKVVSFTKEKSEILISGPGYTASFNWPNAQLRWPVAKSGAFEQTADDIARMF